MTSDVRCTQNKVRGYNEKYSPQRHRVHRVFNFLCEPCVSVFQTDADYMSTSNV